MDAKEADCLRKLLEDESSVEEPFNSGGEDDYDPNSDLEGHLSESEYQRSNIENNISIDRITTSKRFCW